MHAQRQLMNELELLIRNDIPCFGVKTEISTLLPFFETYKLSHVPIVEEGVFLGTFAHEDALTLDESEILDTHRYLWQGFFCRSQMHWLEFWETQLNNESNMLPILDETSKYLGVILLEDLSSIFQQTPFVKEKGALVVVEKNLEDYSMGQIVQIVESANGRILGLFASEMQQNAIQVTVKIASGSIQNMLQTFRRYNYEIISQHDDDSYIANLKERSAYLDRYLNI